MVVAGLIAASVGTVGEIVGEALRGRIAGDVFLPGDDAFAGAQQLWNGAITTTPVLIVRVAGAEDIAAAIRVAKEFELPLAVRGGGHGVGGFALAEGGLVIDTLALKSISVDAELRIVRAGSGNLLDDVNRATQAYGLAIPGGKNATPGLGGVTLGGGIGYLYRKFGPLVDSLLAVELVTANGQFVRASAEENADLFWGLRGGGGNFGVATAFEFRAYPVDQILGGIIVHPFSEAKPLLRFYRDFVASSPDELTTVAALMTGPDGHKVVAIGGAYAGDLLRGERVLAPLREFGSPMLDTFRMMPYDQLPRDTDAMIPAGINRRWRSGLTRALPEPLIDTMISGYDEVPSRFTGILIEQLGGAGRRVAADATAYSHRSAEFGITIDAGWISDADDVANVNWTDSLWRTIKPATTGVYVNFLDNEGESRVREAYTEQAYGRLVDLKRRYDPRNIFRSNQNISPA